MELKTLINADYLDIVFDKRNKNYGGYELRKNYDRRVAKSLGFLLLGVGSMICFSFIGTSGNEKERNHRPVITVMTDVNMVIQPPKPTILPPAPPAPPPPPRPTITFTPPVVEKNDDPVVNPVPDKNTLENNQPGPTNSDLGANDGTIGPPVASGRGTGPAIPIETKPSTPFVYCEQMPGFNGDFNDFINHHISYPEEARAAGIQGRVIVSFVVNEDGAITEAKVVRGIGGGCDEVALHVVNMMPKWKPGKQNGVPVKVFFTLPISFVLSN